MALLAAGRHLEGLQGWCARSHAPHLARGRGLG